MTNKLAGMHGDGAEVSLRHESDIVGVLVFNLNGEDYSDRN